MSKKAKEELRSRTCFICGKVWPKKIKLEECSDLVRVPYRQLACKKCIDARCQPGYTILKACANCVHTFAFSDYDSGVTLYCIKDAPPRPPCGSVALGECNLFLYGPESECIKAMSAWYSWCEGREVKPWAICSRWIRKEEESQSNGN